MPRLHMSLLGTGLLVLASCGQPSSQPVESQSVESQSDQKPSAPVAVDDRQGLPLRVQSDQGHSDHAHASPGETHSADSPADDERLQAAVPDAAVEELNALALFEQRLLPILQSPKPSSCTECHLGGVDLKDYLRPDQAATFAALRERGMIDLDNPDQSKILEFIDRRPEQPNLITEKVRQQELQAFRAWIRAAAKDSELLQATADAQPLGPKLPVEVIRHARQDRVLASFVENVWSEMRRCSGCHSPDQNQKYVKQHGEQVSWIALRDPRATLEYVVDSGLIDTDAPAESLLITKPTMQVEHGGGQKMLIGDRTYRQFLRFIEDYAAIVNGRYASADELPAPADEVSIAVDQRLQLVNVPERLDGIFLRADIYRWEDTGWSARPWASGDRAIWGKGKTWGQHLTLIAPRDSERAKTLRSNSTLPPGRYLIKVYLDKDGKLAKNPSAELGPEDLHGQIELETAWKGAKTEVDFSQLR
jgi:hypothetical protein